MRKTEQLRTSMNSRTRRCIFLFERARAVLVAPGRSGASSRLLMSGKTSGCTFSC
jgi:hypothetical protein